MRSIDSPPTCPCCGNEVGDKPNPVTVIAGIQMGPIARAIYLCLAKRMGKWLNANEIATVVYASDPNGGPEQADTCVRMAIATTRYRLRGTGIVLEGRQFSGYRLRWERA